MINKLICLILLFIPNLVQAQEVSSQNESLHSYMEKAMEEYHIPGAALGVIQDGKVTFKQSFGVQSNDEAVTDNTVFTLGSVSKPLTSLGMMKLAEKEEVKLEDPIDNYIAFDYGQKDSEKEITIKQLLSHTSGISTYDGLKIADQNLRGKHAISEAVELLEPAELTANPGDTHQYSAANYLLLGKIIEEVSGRPFEEYMTETVFADLGMSQTAATYESALKLDYQPGFQSWFGKPLKSDGWFDDSGAPYGYMASTLNDMTKFLQKLLEPDELLSQPFADLYFSPQVHRKGDSYYGLGWRINTNEKDPYLFHGGETPDSKAELFVSQAKDYAFILLTNKNNFSEVMQTAHMRDGIQSIIENQEAKPLPKVSSQMLWSTAIATVIIGLFSLWSMIQFSRKKVRKQKVWVSIAILSLVIGIILIPVLVKIFGSPWHTIVSYAPDIALLVKVIVGILLINGIGLLAIYGKRRADTLY
ncbi:serine hydrolase domain-containing protein [Halobacillus massiliensis]|uniref:serine hydrolase domain-containing protein n=1 Tax=Halobacillus massiliensis TaxID=1926286 RepID=UPI0009E3CBAC|nr:serine hydrolase domain-containing protein [Halobacillus massiliensis]